MHRMFGLYTPRPIKEDVLGPAFEWGIEDFVCSLVRYRKCKMDFIYAYTPHPEGEITFTISISISQESLFDLARLEDCIFYGLSAYLDWNYGADVLRTRVPLMDTRFEEEPPQNTPQMG